MEFTDDPLLQLLDSFQAYSHARVKFLSLMDQASSCRDPLAEFSEVLVSSLLNAQLASSRVQKGYDLTKPDGRHVQVKYLANPNKKNWINEHAIRFTEEAEEYALVIFVELKLKAVIIFQRETIEQVCRLLGKRHPNQKSTSLFTKRNFEQMMAEPANFKDAGVEIFLY